VTPEPAPTAPAAPALGYLDIYAKPFATVEIDGRAMGDAEGKRSFPLKPGKHTVALKHPKREQGATPVSIKAGSHLRLDFDANK
jgi:hypothetical protein